MEKKFRIEREQGGWIVVDENGIAEATAPIHATKEEAQIELNSYIKAFSRKYAFADAPHLDNF